MINYSTCMRGNPTDKDAAKKAYANAQYSQVMTLDKFCYHIASHGCVYSRADIQAILILAVDCLREQLLKHYPHARVPEQPEFANARGMLKFAKHVVGGA